MLTGALTNFTTILSGILVNFLKGKIPMNNMDLMYTITHSQVAPNQNINPKASSIFFLFLIKPVPSLSSKLFFDSCTNSKLFHNLFKFTTTQKEIHVLKLGKIILCHIKDQIISPPFNILQNAIFLALSPNN